MEYVDLREIDNDIKTLSDLNDKELKYICSISTNDSFQFSNKPNCTYFYTTKKEPFSLENSIFDCSLHINYEYYKENFNEIIKKICSIIKEITSNTITLYREFINEDTVKAIVSNSNIKNIRLGLNGDYILEKRIYDILVESKRDDIKEITTFDVSDELSNVFDKRLTAVMKRNIGVSNLEVKDVLERSSFMVDSRDLLEILDIIKNRQHDKSLNDIIINVTDYENLKYFIEEVISKYNSIKIILNLDFRNFKEEIIDDLTKYKNIVVKEDSHEISLALALKKELKIRELLEPVDMIKDKLSPFELYTKLYQTAKDFKPYKEVNNGGNIDDSRNLSKLLFNEYIVCVGYANLLQEFCKRYNIETYYMTVSVVPKDTKDLNESRGHARLLVKMKDEKYGIDGLYVTDPTWDHTDNSKYNHILMTFDEINREINNEIIFNAYDFLNVKSKKEFYALANNPAARKKLRYLSFYIKEFDNDNFERIYKISSFNYDYNLERVESLEKMADYCVNFHQEQISGDTILKALISIYKLENEDLDEMQIIDYFRKIKSNLQTREDISHPTILKENENEKIFDFYNNKYSDSDIENIVINERKNTR